MARRRAFPGVASKVRCNGPAEAFGRLMLVNRVLFGVALIYFDRVPDAWGWWLLLIFLLRNSLSFFEG